MALRLTVDELLTEARSGIERLGPEETAAAMSAGAVLVDIRSEYQRDRDGVVPGSVFVPRNSLEWRCDPSSPWRHPAITSREVRLILVCHEGYQSSLAAATLQQLGLANATDLDGGFTAWAAAGLPVTADAAGL